MHARVERESTSEEIIATVVKRLRGLRLLERCRLPETFPRLRQENEKLGKHRIQQDLQQKGVHADLITETIDARYGDTNEEALARQHLERKRIKKPENKKETARVVRVGSGIFNVDDLQDFHRGMYDESLTALERIEDEPHKEYAGCARRP